MPKPIIWSPLSDNDFSTILEYLNETKHNTLYYRDRKDSVDILRIYDNRQDPQKLLF